MLNNYLTLIEETVPRDIDIYYVIYLPRMLSYLSSVNSLKKPYYTLLPTCNKKYLIWDEDRKVLEKDLDDHLDLQGTTLRSLGFKVVKIMIKEVKSYWAEQG
jgi:hypothetical protein